jgi:hypothetical protein
MKNTALKNKSRGTQINNIEFEILK